jgi:hypothetical protein
MSYCRWSSDDFKCDLYCYEDVSGGFITHVASNRVVGEVPRLEWEDLETNIDQFMASSKAQSAFLETAERRPIGLPCDGQRFNDPDLDSFLARLEALRAMGYHLPDYVLEDVRDEIKKGPREE